MPTTCHKFAVTVTTAATALLIAAIPAAAQTPEPGTGADPVVIEDFSQMSDGEPVPDFGLFNFPPAGSGSSNGLSGTSETGVRFGEQWQYTPENANGYVNELTINDDPDASGSLTFGGEFSASWNVRHVANGGAPTGEQVGDGENVLYTNSASGGTGWLGFYARTDDQDLLAAPAIDEFTGDASTEIGARKQIEGDGQWHQYQWDLSDNDNLDAFFGASDGQLDRPNGTLDSLNFWNTGPDDGQTTNLDLAWVAYDPDSPLMDLTDIGLEGDLDGDGSVLQSDLSLVLSNWGQDTVPSEWVGGFDGDVSQNELSRVLSNWGAGSSSNVSELPSIQSLPEPSSAAWLALGAAALVGRRRRASMR
jgi:MYXO-CTERM domain-containing protein